MAAREPVVDEIAAAILDGSTIDWDGLGTATSDPDRRLIEELRLLATVAEVHRRPLDTLPQEAAAPQTWGHLRLLERLGGGSFGEVYRAHDTRLEREVAVKLMRASRSSDAGIAAIIREGRLLARVRHPGVVTVYDAQQIGNRVGMWMEYVRGQTLEERLERHGVCTAAEAIEIGIELCRAVTAVHDAELLHRDIKTQNVMRADDGRLLLMDFGIGRDLADGTAMNLAGTPLYLAPELLRGEPASVNTDIYAIGVLLFRVLTRSFPVRAKQLPDLRRAHETGDRQSLREARPDLPANLAAVIDRAMDPEPGRRFGSAAELGKALESVRPRVRSRRWMLIAAAMAVIAAGAALAVQRGWIAIGGHRGPLLDPQQWVLIAEFTSTTGDADLDAAVRQAVISELESSTYVNVFPSAYARETLSTMARPPATRLDATTGLAVARHAGVGGLVTGSVDSRGGAYRIAVRATHVPSGRVLDIPAEPRRTREETLQAAFSLGRKLRELLGESTTSIDKTSPPLIPVTSQSFDALRHFAIGRRLYEEERYRDALPSFVEATARDPDFAMAHLYVALSHGNLLEYALRDQAIERAATLAGSSSVGTIEREKILADYSSSKERFEDAAAHMRVVLDLRPRDGRMLGNVGVIHGNLRQYQQAIKAFEAALETFPHPRVRSMLADMYTASGQPRTAIDLLAPHLDRIADFIGYSRHLAIAGDREAAADALTQAERLATQPGSDPPDTLALARADLLRSGGRYDAAETVLRQGLDQSRQGVTERLDLAMGSLLLESGRRVEAVTRLRGIDVSHSRNRIVLGVLAARARDLETANVVLAQLQAEWADHQALRAEARVHQLQAEIALAGGQRQAARDHAAQAVKAFDTTWTRVTLARAQQALGRIDDAIATWTRILERPGERAMDWDAPAYSQVVLAHFEIAKLFEQAGRIDEARANYDEFLRLWERADPDLPALREARARRGRLTPSGQGAQSNPAGRVPKPAA